MARKKSVHYVDNKKFLEAITCWRENCQDAEEAGDEVPPLTNYIGECFLKIATHLSYKPNFINYSYQLCILIIFWILIIKTILVSQNN